MTVAERRMIARSLVESDAFLDISLEAQYLYVHLVVNADDRGLLERGRAVCRMVGVDTSRIQELENAGFILLFDTGVLAIVDWEVQNHISEKRRSETRFVEEFSHLTIGEDKRYYLIDDGFHSRDRPGCSSHTNCDPTVYKLHANCMHSIGKDRLVENSIGKKSGEEENGGEYGEEETPFTIPPPTLTDQTMKAEAIRKLREHKSQG